MRKTLLSLGSLLLLWPLVGAPKATPVMDGAKPLAARGSSVPAESEVSAPSAEPRPLSLVAAREQLERLEALWLTWANAPHLASWLPPLAVRTLGTRTPEASLSASRELLTLPEQTWNAPSPFTDSPQLGLHHALLLAGIAPVARWSDIEPLLEPTAPATHSRLALELELLSLYTRRHQLPAEHATPLAQRQQQLLTQALSRLHRALSTDVSNAPSREVVELLTLASSAFRATGLESHPQIRQRARRNHALLYASSRHWTDWVDPRASTSPWERLLLSASLVETFASYSAAGLAPANSTTSTLAPHLQELVHLVSRTPLDPTPKPLSAWALSAALRALRLTVNVHTHG